MTENRHGLVVETERGAASGTIEREAAQTVIVRHSPGSRRITLGADKAYDTRDFVYELRDLNVTSHIAQNISNGPRPSMHAQRGIRATRSERTEEPFDAYDLIRLLKLLGALA